MSGDEGGEGVVGGENESGDVDEDEVGAGGGDVLNQKGKSVGQSVIPQHRSTPQRNKKVQ